MGVPDGSPLTTKFVCVTSRKFVWNFPLSGRLGVGFHSCAHFSQTFVAARNRNLKRTEIRSLGEKTMSPPKLRNHVRSSCLCNVGVMTPQKLDKPSAFLIDAYPFSWPSPALADKLR